MVWEGSIGPVANLVLSARLTAVLALTAFLSVAASRAHEGHDDGDRSPSSVVTETSTRFAAQSDDFELVAAPDGAALRIHLDVMDSNEPVSGAELAVAGEDSRQRAQEIAPGTYRVPAEWARVPGTHFMTIVVKLGDRHAEFSGSLLIPTPTAPASTPSGYAGWLRGGALAALGFGVALAAFRSGRERLGGAVLAMVMALILLATGARGHEITAEHSPVQSTAAADPAPHRHPDGSVFLAKSAQQLLGIRTLRAEPKEEALRYEIYGRVVADPNASARLQAVRDGRIEAPPAAFCWPGKRSARVSCLPISCRRSPAPRNFRCGSLWRRSSATWPCSCRGRMRSAPSTRTCR
jgi:cobalt-zinc-cadmium efflux system membrane fusion protein